MQFSGCAGIMMVHPSSALVGDSAALSFLETLHLQASLHSRAGLLVAFQSWSPCPLQAAQQLEVNSLGKRNLSAVWHEGMSMWLCKMYRI